MKKTVFISSTYEDLKQYRAKIWDTLSQYDVDIRGTWQAGTVRACPLGFNRYRVRMVPGS